MASLQRARRGRAPGRILAGCAGLPGMAVAWLLRRRVLVRAARAPARRQGSLRTHDARDAHRRMARRPLGRTRRLVRGRPDAHAAVADDDPPRRRAPPVRLRGHEPARERAAATRVDLPPAPRARLRAGTMAARKLAGLARLRARAKGSAGIP